METGPGHSAEFLGDYRDHWWNQDFLKLMAQRLEFTKVARVLDVGCGQGHWGRTVLRHVPETARLVGVDPEARWVEKAAEAARQHAISDRTEYAVGRAESLPFADGAFDLVTCQTVLMHLPDVAAALREMVRVTRPGGRVLAVEPNNDANAAVLNSERKSMSLEARLRLQRFQALCGRGKTRLGMGNGSVGDLLPELFADAGLSQVQVYLNDRAPLLMPPYADSGQRMIADQIVRVTEKGIWIWDRDETRRCFLAGGGEESEFQALWEEAMAVSRAEARAIRDGRLVDSGGHLTYLVSGVKL
jgi:SAM-dependent methyltransferase